MCDDHLVDLQGNMTSAVMTTRLFYRALWIVLCSDHMLYHRVTWLLTSDVMITWLIYKVAWPVMWWPRGCSTGQHDYLLMWWPRDLRATWPMTTCCTVRLSPWPVMWWPHVVLLIGRGHSGRSPCLQVRQPDAYSYRVNNCVHRLTWLDSCLSYYTVWRSLIYHYRNLSSNPVGSD